MEPYKVTFGIYRGPSDEELHPENLLRIPYDNFVSEIIDLKELNQFIPKITEQHVKDYKKRLEKKISNLDAEGKKEYSRYNQWQTFVRNKKDFEKDSTFITYHKDLTNILNDRDKSMDLESSSGWFTRKMSLIYLISQFNEFLRGCIWQTFVAYPEILKSPVSIKFNDMYKFENIEEFRVDIADKEADVIMRQGIERINKHLKILFNLSLKKNKDWNDFKERFYRRNILLHNAGISNQIYKIRTNDVKGKRDVRVTKAYLTKSINLFDKYGKQIWIFFNKKYFSKVTHEE